MKLFHEGSAGAQSEAMKNKRRNAIQTMDDSNHTLPADKRRLDFSNSKEFKFQELAMLSITPIVRSIHHWWLQRAERHYLICADVEQQRAREAQMNAAYYQKRAALARSARM